MGRRPGQSLWSVLLFGLAIGFALAVEAWGELAALGAVVAVIAVVVLARRLSGTARRRTLGGSRGPLIGRPRGSDEAGAAPTDDARRIAEEAFGAQAPGMLRRPRRTPRS